MKKGIHPETYRLVAFKDMSNDTVFVTRSCDPFYTGKVKLVDTAGRVDMFYQRYKSRKK